ncbi:MAG: hypothetical protein ACREIC_27515, partial [Limisphaerales bacterium]
MSEKTFSVAMHSVAQPGFTSCANGIIRPQSRRKAEADSIFCALRLPVQSKIENSTIIANEFYCFPS